MSVSKYNEHKRCKTGRLPGDLSVRAKADMLEHGKNSAYDQQYPGVAAAFRRDHYKRANRRFRHQPIPQDAQ